MLGRQTRLRRPLADVLERPASQRLPGTGYIDGGRKQITAWLYQALLENKPYDQFVRELISPTAESEGFINGIKWRGRVNASQVPESSSRRTSLRSSSAST